MVGTEGIRASERSRQLELRRVYAASVSNAYGEQKAPIEMVICSDGAVNRRLSTGCPIGIAYSNAIVTGVLQREEYLNFAESPASQTIMLGIPQEFYSGARRL